MLFINYKGDTPQQRFYTLGVKGNNKANKIKFVVARHQADIDLSGYVCNLKVQNKEHDWLDLIMLDGVVNTNTDTIEYEWLMTSKSTQFRNLELQLEFISTDNEENVVFQTLICELELNETIKVGDEQPDDEELSALKQVEQEVKRVDNKVDDLADEVLDIKEHRIWDDVYIHYFEQTNSTYFRFPRGVIPLRFEIGDRGIDIYFDYRGHHFLNYKGLVDDSLNDNFQYEDTSMVAIGIKGNFTDIDFDNEGVDLKYILRECTDDYDSISFNSFEVIGNYKDDPTYLATITQTGDGITQFMLPCHYLPISMEDGEQSKFTFNYRNKKIYSGNREVGSITQNSYGETICNINDGEMYGISHIACVKGDVGGLLIDFTQQQSLPMFRWRNSIQDVINYYEAHIDEFADGYMTFAVNEGYDSPSSIIAGYFSNRETFVAFRGIDVNRFQYLQYTDIQSNRYGDNLGNIIENAIEKRSYVDTDTTQAIGGRKRFTDDTTFESAIFLFRSNSNYTQISSSQNEAFALYSELYGDDVLAVKTDGTLQTRNIEPYTTGTTIGTNNLPYYQVFLQNIVFASNGVNYWGLSWYDDENVVGFFDTTYDKNVLLIKHTGIEVDGDVSATGMLRLQNSQVKDFIKLTQAEYDALVQGGFIDPDTFYFIEEE